MRTSLLIFSIVIIGCNKNQNTYHYQAPAVLDSLAKHFVYEAAARGHSIDLTTSGLTLQFGKLEATENAHCNPSSFPKIITIDSAKWQTYSPVFKEYIVYHELAHCFLNRMHVEDNVLELGECRSWMRKDNGQCFIDFLSKSWRRYYVDELFLPDVDKPAWYRPEEKLVSYNLRKSRIKLIELNKYGYLKDSILFTPMDDWIIEARLSYLQPEQGEMHLQLDNLVMKASYKSLYPVKEAFIEDISIERFDPSMPIQRTQVYSLFSTPSHEPTKELVFSIQKRNQAIYLFVNHQLKHCTAAEGSEKYIDLYFSMSNPCSLEIFQLN